MQTEDRARQVYDDAAETYQRLLPDLRSEAPVDRAMIAAFAEHVAAAGGRVLDAGCGPGRLVGELRRLGLGVVGADISPAMIERARALFPDLRFDVAPLGELPYDDNSFDGLITWYSLIHTHPRDLPRTLTELVRVLRPGGHLLAGFQIGTGERVINNAYGTGHELTAFLFTPPDISAALTATGLSIAAVTIRTAIGERYDQGFVMATRPAG